MAESPSVPESAIEASSKPFPFLKLNKDIRFMVYDILEALPRNDMDREDRDRVSSFGVGEYGEFEKFTVTRKSLRLTCKQIKNEWTPAFLRSTTFCLDLNRMPMAFEIFVLNNLSKTEIMNVRRLAFNGSRQGLFAKYGCPHLRSSDAEVLRSLASVLIRHEERLILETLDVEFCDDFGPRLLRRENEVTVEQITRYSSRAGYCWNPYYIGMFETQMLGTVLKGASVLHLLERGALQLFFRRRNFRRRIQAPVRLQHHRSASDSRPELYPCEAEWDQGTYSSNTTTSTEEDDSCDGGADSDAKYGSEDSSEIDEDLPSDANEEEIAEDEADDDENDASSADQGLSHQELEAIKNTKVEHTSRRKRTFAEVEE
ncbi:hypothetical protein H2202_004125 [Exophiala xenobiotica]|nr:hypothetical protein H2202_004125 [Exophiala xenobiotica]KAK5257757.1 hypothetical protein LTR40_009256 [Exophiala xenobiotica]KAK5374755.1 hypothetical protein LTS13_005323 [Exophiala xenobiotica]KAK5396906.1 hypothetical protein LTR79_005542 [Exophiala xenobiotica]KAK5410685.1 hypothetical protein LTR90_008268 [Exophiala xenobiotica]